MDGLSRGCTRIAHAPGSRSQVLRGFLRSRPLERPADGARTEQGRCLSLEERAYVRTSGHDSTATSILTRTKYSSNSPRSKTLTRKFRTSAASTVTRPVRGHKILDPSGMNREYAADDFALPSSPWFVAAPCTSPPHTLAGRVHVAHELFYLSISAGVHDKPAVAITRVSENATYRAEKPSYLKLSKTVRTTAHPRKTAPVSWLRRVFRDRGRATLLMTSSSMSIPSSLAEKFWNAQQQI